MPRDPGSVQLKSVAPLVTLGAAPAYLGPVLLVQNAGQLLGATSLDLLRPVQDLDLAVITSLDGSTSVRVKSWRAGRYQGLGLVELDGALPDGCELIPLDLDAMCATIDTRGAPAGLVAFIQRGTGYERRMVPVYVDSDDAGGMSDIATRLASPLDAADAAIAVEGAPLFAWFPPDPVLGRPHEVLVLAVGCSYRAKYAQPRDTPVIAELLGLDDLGRALIKPSEPDARAELADTAGEIGDKPVDASMTEPIGATAPELVVAANAEPAELAKPTKP